MTVSILDPSCDAGAISGFTVVVDVFRAFSVSYYINAQHPAKYIVVDDVDLAFALRDKEPNAILVGERQGIKIPGFDLGNSPTEILDSNLAGKTVIHTTTAGTKGLARQPKENDVVVGSFVNARAIANHVLSAGIDTVNIYCTAPKGYLFGEEDYLFADYLAGLLKGVQPDFASIRQRLKSGSGQGFSEMGFAPVSDFLLCMDLDRFDSLLTRKIIQGSMHSMELIELGASGTGP